LSGSHPGSQIIDNTRHDEASGGVEAHDVSMRSRLCAEHPLGDAGIRCGVATGDRRWSHDRDPDLDRIELTRGHDSVT